MSGRSKAPRGDPPAPSTPETWPELASGTTLAVVKLDPAGHEVTRYPGRVIAAGAPTPWLAVEAAWTSRPVTLDGLRFVPGDTLHEYFSPAHPFNVFAVFAPNGRLRGWYANVTHPAVLDPRADPPLLIWRDLYVDLIGLPDGTAVVRDEDELAASGLGERDPPLGAAILTARDDLLRRFAQRAVPFHDRDRER